MVEVSKRAQFPILGSGGATIDYQLVAYHGKQARENHYQSVDRLAERGGLSWCELHAVLHNRKWQKMDTNDAMVGCRALEARYLAALADTKSETAMLREALREEVINAPETADFMAGVPLEAAHQRERWGADHDAGKSPFDWFWLVGYLAQKAASSAVAGDLEKAKHHTISTAAALANWHAALTGAHTVMRPGIGPGNGGEKDGSAHSLAAALTGVSHER